MILRIDAILILVIIFINISCTGPAVQQVPAAETGTGAYAEFNHRVRKSTDINSPVELIKYYYGEIDDNQDIVITVENLKENRFEIILIQEDIKDDSIAGMKIVMIADLLDGNWTVLDVQRTWKCQKWRGHSKYNSKPCN